MHTCVLSVAKPLQSTCQVPRSYIKSWRSHAASCWHHTGVSAGPTTIKLSNSGMRQVRGERRSSLLPCMALFVAVVDAGGFEEWDLEWCMSCQSDQTAAIHCLPLVPMKHVDGWDQEAQAGACMRENKRLGSVAGGVERVTPV